MGRITRACPHVSEKELRARLKRYKRSQDRSEIAGNLECDGGSETS